MSLVSRKNAPVRVPLAGARTGRDRRAVHRASLGLLGLLAVAGLVGCGTAAKPAAGSAHAVSPGASGGYPSYLPKGTLHYHSDTVLSGTTARPALTSQGDGVQVKTARWSVLVTVTGPQVPGEGLPYQASATTCTWVVTMSGATAPVPISTADFTAIDDETKLYRPALVPGQPEPPAVLRPGQKISFELRAVEAVGEGLMRWAPDGRDIVAKWDFVVEND